MNAKKQKRLSTLLYASLLLWLIYAILTSLISLLPQTFLPLVFGDTLIKEAVQNFYQIAELIITGIIYLLCFYFSRKKIHSQANNPTALGIGNILMSICVCFLIPFAFTILSSHYSITLLANSEAAFSCFSATIKFTEFLRPFLYSSIALFLCAYGTYWLDMSCQEHEK